MLSTSGSSKLTFGALSVILQVRGVLKVRPDTILPPHLGLETVGERAGPSPEMHGGMLSHSKCPPGCGNWQNAGPLEEERLIPADVLWSRQC